MNYNVNFGCKPKALPLCKPSVFRARLPSRITKRFDRSLPPTNNQGLALFCPVHRFYGYLYDLHH